MNNFIWQTHHRLVAKTSLAHQRYLHKQLDLKQRLTGIVGPRGVGKTTTLLQTIKRHFQHTNNVIYASLDAVVFSHQRLLDWVDELYRLHDVRYFFLDEIHKYPNWSQELKNIYDAFPDVHVFFSGSSSMDLHQGAYDLSRRVRLLYLPGLSFREYLAFSDATVLEPVTLEALLEGHQELANNLNHVPNLLQKFQNYRESGYYPVVFEDPDGSHDRFMRVIDQVIYEDISHTFSMKTRHVAVMKRLLHFLASIPPGEVRPHNLAKRLQIDTKTVDTYLDVLERAQLVRRLDAQAKGAQILTKPAKLYIDNTTLMHALHRELGSDPHLGNLRELFFLQSLAGTDLTAHYPKQGDFQIRDVVVEVGGPNKGRAQLQGCQARTVVAQDGIRHGYGTTIPLYLFGFLY